MAIYERGYRAYEGVYRTAPGWWIVAREGWALASKHRGVRWIGVIILLIAGGASVFLFFQLGIQQVTDNMKGVERSFEERSIELMAGAHYVFYEFSTILAILAGVMVSCGLVADDLRSRALTLYLVRPISRFSYVFGKALVLPGVFLVLSLIPGIMLWLLVGLWQPPGETWSFLSANSNAAGRALEHYVVVTVSMTGLMLLLSSVTHRRGVAMAAGAAITLLGGVLALFGELLSGVAGEIGGALAIPRNALRDIRLMGPEATGYANYIPTDRGVLIVTVALIAGGIAAITWRARTTEVAE